MIKTVLLDLDGTVYEGNRLIDGADIAIKKMREKGLKVFFCTNNSGKTAASIADKLSKMGIDCKECDVVSSGQMALHMALFQKLENVYFSGSEALQKEFVDKGVDLCDEKHAKNLIIALDIDFNYDKMLRATRAALNAEKIIVCNEDKLYPREDGLCPGCGAIVASILTAATRKADIILGKPNTMMMEYVSSLTGDLPPEMIVIGDTYETDAMMAINYGSRFTLISDKTETDRTIKSLRDTIDWDWETI